MNDKDIKKKILKILKEDTLSKSSVGFIYLFDCIYECFKKRSLLNNLNKELFVRVAEKEETTPARVDRIIRHSISNSKLGKTTTECIQTVLLMLEME